MAIVASMARWKTFCVSSARTSACMWCSTSCRSSVHGRTPGEHISTPPGGGPRHRTPTTQAPTACLALPPIRTFTVGPGVSPGQPAAGCGRVADFDRRLGIAPTPEHVEPVCTCVDLPCTRRPRDGHHAPGAAAARYGDAMDCDDYQRAALRTARDKDAP